MPDREAMQYSAAAMDAMSDIRDWFARRLSAAALDLAAMDGRATATEDDVIRASATIDIGEMGYEDEPDPDLEDAS